MSESLKIDRWFRAFEKMGPGAKSRCAAFFKISTGISSAPIFYEDRFVASQHQATRMRAWRRVRTGTQPMQVTNRPSSGFRGRTFSAARRHDQHRTGRARYNLLRYAAQYETVDADTAVCRYHDQIHAFACRHFDDIFVWRAELDDLTHFHQVDAIGKMLGEESIQNNPAVCQHVAARPKVRSSVLESTAKVDNVIDQHLGAGIARRL
jgi:hypothetical protein